MLRDSLSLPIVYFEVHVFSFVTLSGKKLVHINFKHLMLPAIVTIVSTSETRIFFWTYFPFINRV